MKKLFVVTMSLICMCSLSAFADCNCHKKPKPAPAACEQPCPQTCQTPCANDTFLCTKVNMDTLFRCMNLSNTQICNAHKIQEKYEQEVYSLSERIQCEKQKLCQLERTCAKNSDIRKQKRLIKRLEKDKKKICKCYEKQFKATLSNQQIKAYNKNKK